jgi:molybdopterin converting factor small subunit
MSAVNVTVEFLGIVRHRAGCESAQFQAETMQQLWKAVGARFPELEGTCLVDGRLQPGYLASVEGLRFTRAAELKLTEGDRVLLLSADAGG